MNNTLNNLLKISINKLALNKPCDKNDKLYYVCKLTNKGLKFDKDNKLGLSNYSIQGDIYNYLLSIKDIFDKDLNNIIFNEYRIEEKDFYFWKIILFGLIYNVSKLPYYCIVDNELYLKK